MTDQTELERLKAEMDAAWVAWVAAYAAWEVAFGRAMVAERKAEAGLI